MSSDKLASILRKVIDVEGPIHTDELLRACAEIFQIKATPRTRRAVERATALAIEKDWALKKGSFLYSPKKSKLKIRRRGNDCPVTAPDLIPPEEFDAAILLILRQQFGLRSDDLAEAVSDLLGYSRTAPKFRSTIDSAITRLTKQFLLKRDSSGFITLASPAKS